MSGAFAAAAIAAAIGAPLVLEGWRTLAFPSMFALSALALQVYMFVVGVGALGVALTSAKILTVILRAALAFVLEFDQRRDKAFDVGKGLRNRNWQAVLDEIAKCDVVCANCHRRRTARGGFARAAVAQR